MKGVKTMNTHYDKKLKQLDFYNIHPEYLPFIGDKYDKYKILLIGDSHYIEQTYENEKYGLQYFADHWWNGSCTALSAESYSNWYNTRNVISNYLSGNRRHGHLIFTNVIKTFSAVVLKEEISCISTPESQKYNYFSFMNFFQMPSIYTGTKFWDSILASAKKAGNKPLAYQQWEKCVQVSSNILDHVIEILSPKLVVFTSTSAYHAYKNANAKYANEKFVVATPHPASPAWNKTCKNYGGIRGKDLFANYLQEFIIAQ